MDRSEQINELASSLAKAQGQMMHATKDSVNPHFRSKYADLASVWEACRKPLADNGLSIVQLPEPADTGLVLNTVLMHSSGQWIGSKIAMPLQKADPQGYGSVLTYARRYALAAIVGVYQDDDDGSAATEQHNKAAHVPVQQPQSADKATEAQVKMIYSKGKSSGMDVDTLNKALRNRYGVGSAAELTKAQASSIIAMQFIAQ